MIDLNDIIKTPRKSNCLKFDTLYRSYCNLCNKDKGYKRKTDANRVCLSCSRKGHSLSQDIKDKISIAIKALPPISLEARNKISKANKGRVVDVDTKIKLSCAHRQIPIEEFNDFLTSKNKRDRNLINKNGISRQVYLRDNHSCTICLKSKTKLNAHHLESFHKDHNLRLNIDNMVTLCVDCHKKFHAVYGHKNNTKMQFEDFKLLILKEAK